MNKHDVIIIGGGSAGLGVALSESNNIQKSNNVKNRKILLLEKEKLSNKTSNSSLRIIHGGLRYLQKMDILRVIESLKAQDELLKAYPEHIEKLNCIMPLKKFGLKSKYPMICASILYNMISLLITGKSNGAYVGKIKNHKNNIDIINNKEEYALFWNDALLKNPLNFAKDLKFELIKKGIEIKENQHVLSVKKENDEFIVTSLSEIGEKLEFKCNYVVNTTGPWYSKIEESHDIKSENDEFKWCKAFNIILNERATFSEAIGVFGEDNRAFFIVPRDGYIAVGSWYVPFNGSLEDITPTNDELQAFANSFNKVNLNLKINKNNIREIEAGILPMKGIGSAGPTLYGLEKISVKDNYIKVLSTKYTTFLAQGRKVSKFIK